MRIRTQKVFLPLFLSLELVQGQANVTGSLEASQLAANSFLFIISAPANCLQTLVDLPNSVSKNMAALWIRAVFHDAGTWQPNAPSGSKGGADASMLKHLDHVHSSGLSDSVAPKFQQNPKVAMTHADMIALAGLVGVVHCGGPKMNFKAGRVDALPGHYTSPDGRLPEPNITLADFKTKATAMGWFNEDIVALVTGSHTMGGVHAANSPTLTNKTFVPFDDTAGIFDNKIFTFTLQGYCPVPIDCEIAKDPILGPIVKKFASDQNAFFEQYAISFQKLYSQTTSKLGSEQEIKISYHAGLTTTPQPPVNFTLPSSSSTSLSTISCTFIYYLLSLYVTLVQT